MVWRKNKNLWRRKSRVDGHAVDELRAELARYAKPTQESSSPLSSSTTHVNPPQYSQRKPHSDAQWLKDGGWSGKR